MLMLQSIHKQVHEGRNVKRFREFRGMQLSSLAQALDISLEELYAIEQTAVLDEAILRRIGIALNISIDTLRSMEEEAPPVKPIVDGETGRHGCLPHCSCSRQEKIIELYERLLRDKEAMILLLEKLLSERPPRTAPEAVPEQTSERERTEPGYMFSIPVPFFGGRCLNSALLYGIGLLLLTG